MTARPPRSKEPTKLQRERELNFIYFIDSSKTHTFKMRLTVFRYIAGGVALFVLSALAAFYLLYKIEDDRQNILSDLRRSQTTIFDYQTRHDGVYEKAYPSATRQNTTKIAAQPSSSVQEKDPAPVVAPVPSVVASSSASSSAASSPTSAASPTISSNSVGPSKATTETPGESAAEVSKGANQSDGQVMLKFAELQKPEASPTTISVESPSVALGSQSLHFRFDMRNMDSTKRAEGKLCIVAAFEDESGKRSYVTEPRSIRIASDGKVVNPERGVRYNIATFYHRDFKLPVPASFKNHRLVEMLLILTDKSGVETAEYRAPVNAKHALSN